MTTKTDAIIENLTTLMLVIGERAELRRWFQELAKKPSHERMDAIVAMSERIAIEGEEAGLAGSLMLLADARVFEAARLALQER